MKKIAILSILGIMLVLGFSGCGNGTTNENSEFTVTFDLDGGNIDGVTTSVSITVSSGGTISNIPNPNKDGYDFGGFFTQNNGEGSAFTESTTVTENITVYAKWTLLVCDIDPDHHYLPCDFGCDQTPRGYITETNPDNSIPIYQRLGVTDDQAILATEKIITSWDGVSGSNRIHLKGKIKEVWIIQEADDDLRLFDYESSDSKIILKIQYDCEWFGAIFNETAQAILGHLGWFETKAEMPIASKVGGTYIGPQSISLSTTSSGARIYYTLDGSIPTISSFSTSSVGYHPIIISETTTLKAVAVGGSGNIRYNYSEIMTETYTIE